LVVVAVGAMLATWPVAVAPDSADQVTVAVWPAFSLVASASAKLACACIFGRAAIWVKPLLLELLLELLEPVLPLEVPVPAGLGGADRGVDRGDRTGHRRGQHRTVHRPLVRVDRLLGRGHLRLGRRDGRTVRSGR